MSRVYKKQAVQDIVLEYFKLDDINDTKTVLNRKREYENRLSTEELDSSFLNSNFVIENPLFVSRGDLVNYVMNVSKEKYGVPISRNTVADAIEQLGLSGNSVFSIYRSKEVDILERKGNIVGKLLQLYKMNTEDTNFKLVVINAEVLSDDLTKYNEYKDFFNKVDDFISDSFKLININKKYKNVDLSKEQLDSLFKVHNLLMDVKKELLTMESNK